MQKMRITIAKIRLMSSHNLIQLEINLSPKVKKKAEK